MGAASATGGKTPYISRTTLTSAETSASMMFEVALKMRNFAELQTRISHGEHISPQEMAAKYEPLAADYQSVLDWLKGAGFTIVRTDSHHLAIFAQGTVSQVATALKVTFARVAADGKEYTSALNAPSVPASISPFLIGINGLQPHLHAHKHLLKQQAQPNATTGSASYLPSQIAQAYGAAGLYSTNISGGGETIAIVIDTFPSTTDLLLFWKNCNVAQSINNISFVQAVPGTLSSPSGEESLDTEWSSAMAPNAHIRIYATKDLAPADLDMGYLQVLADVTNHPGLGIHQMSMSYGEGETFLKASGGGPVAAIESADQDFAELANAGVTCFASSGDSGSSPGPGGTGDESGPVQVEYPASDPNVIGVGGTTLELNSNNTTSLEKAWNNSSGASGGGVSIFFNQPSWQTGSLGVPTGMRDVPDVAATADPNYGAIIYVGGAQLTVGGTSWASPMWAAFCALINQARTNAGVTPLGTPGSSSTTETLATDIYSILNSASSATNNYATDFNDITSGNNITSISGGDYSTATDYDLVTGIGSPHTGALAQTLIGTATLMGVQMPPAMSLIEPGCVTSFSVAVGGSSATYQWQRMPNGSTAWSNLSDNGTYSGSGTASLTITNATTAMSGDLFQCLITLGNNVVITSTPSALAVDMPLVISTLAGNTGTGALVNATGTAAEFDIPSGIAIDTSGNLYIADYSNNVIREVTTAGVVTTPYGSTAGTAGHAEGSGNSATFDQPNGIVADSSNNLYVADTGNNLIRKISGGTVSNFGGGGEFNLPEGVAVDGSGNVYVADTGDDLIKEISSTGVVSTFAGQTGQAGYANGAATTQALFNSPSAVAVDGSGNVYVADFGNSVIRKISGGQVTTLAGQAGVGGYLDGPSSSALFNTPSGVAVDGVGNVYVADCLVPALNANGAGNDLVRKISTTGAVTTLAGQPGNEGSASGTGSSAQFYSVQAVALNHTTGTFYFADTYNQTIRMGTVEPAPVLSLSATVPTAMVFGPTPGQITFTRAGDTTDTLAVTYSASGTAVASGAGVANPDYTALPGIVTIPAGETTAVVSINPIADNTVTSSPTVQLSLDTSEGYTLGSPDSATVSIEEMTPYQTWASAEFGANATVSTIGSETADPNNNGVPNLLEYAFNSNPLQTGTEPLPVASTIVVGNEEYLDITYTMLNNAPDLTYTVQVTSDLTGVTDQWHSGSTYTTVVGQNVSGNVTQVTVRDNTPISSNPFRFIRVQVSEN